MAYWHYVSAPRLKVAKNHNLGRDRPRYDGQPLATRTLHRLPSGVHFFQRTMRQRGICYSSVSVTALYPGGVGLTGIASTQQVGVHDPALALTRLRANPLDLVGDGTDLAA